MKRFLSLGAALSLLTIVVFYSILPHQRDFPTENQSELNPEVELVNVAPVFLDPGTRRERAALQRIQVHDVESIFPRFLEWAEKAILLEPSDEELEMGISLAQQRRSALKELIQSDPEQALKQAVPWRIRVRLPDAIVVELEERVSTLAEYSVNAAVPLPGREYDGPPILRSARIEDEYLKANVYGARTWITSKDQLPVEGIAVDDQLAILDSPLRLLEPDEPLPGDPVPLVSPEHDPGTDAGGGEIWISGGRPYELCCNNHATSLEESLAGLEQQIGQQLAAFGDPSAVFSDSQTIYQASSHTEGNKSLLVIRVDFPDLQGAPQDSSNNTIDAAYLTSRVTEISNWIQEVSYGKSSMSLQPSDVTAVLRMSQNTSNYNNDTLRSEALSLAQTAGFVTSNYDRVAMVFNDLSSVGITYGGLATVGGNFSWYNGNFSFGVATHEFGHNYGLFHANRWQIPNGSNDPVDPAGSSTEYGDVFDIMGSSPSDPATNRDHFNPWFLNMIDWLGDTSVRTITGDGTYRLHRYDHRNANASNQLALKIGRVEGVDYWIGYRRKYVGHGSNSDVSNGAYIIWGYDINRTSNLIDIDTPGTTPQDASLNVGDSFVDAAAGISLSVVSAGGAGIDEYLDIGVSFIPRIGFSQSSYEVEEVAGNLVVTLERTRSSIGAVSLNLATVDGTATAPADYTAVSTSVSWADGDDSPKTVLIPIVADAVIEGSETFTIQLSSITGAIAVDGTSLTATIIEPGASDPSFSHDFFNASSSVVEMALQPDGKIGFVGRASNIDNTEAVSGIGRLNADGSHDITFSAGALANSTPLPAIARQVDGKFIVGGPFTQINTTPRNRIARINEDGTLDTSFDPGSGANGTVEAIAVRPDGRILVGGDFTTFNGVARRGIAQLLPDGSLDTSFLSTPLSGFQVFEVLDLAVQADGKVIIGGLIYTSSFQSLFSGGFSSGLLRLNTDGTIDTGFDIGSGAHSTSGVGNIRRVYSLCIQPDGKVLVGGSFTAFRGTNTNYLVRLFDNGTVDTSFVSSFGTGADNLVESIYVQGDDSILLGGRFSTMAGNSRPRVARLQASGAFDSGFDASIPPTFGGGASNYCNDIVMQPDTRILVALDAFGDTQAGVKRVFSGQSSPSGVVSFASSSSTVLEGQSASITVQRTGGSLGAISVSYATITGTAGSSDFTGETGTLNWSDGDSADKVITIDTSTDATLEPNELFSIQLGTPIGATHLGSLASTSVTIEDPTPIESWRFTNFGSTANSGNGADISDPDFDLIVNLIEYGLDRSPNNGLGADGVDGLPRESVTATEPVLAGRLVLVADLPDPARSDLVYTVQVNGTLDAGSWTTIATKTGTGPWTWNAGGTSRIVESTNAGRSTVKVGDTALLSAGGTRFMRLGVARQ